MEEETLDWQQKAVEKVLKDFERSEEFLRPFHTECLERYEHYRSSQLSTNIHSREKNNRFPVPFTTEQVNSLVKRVREKLFYKNRPCSIYGREKTDEREAVAKREMFDYQDSEDEIESKNAKGVLNAAIYGICPAQIVFKKEFDETVVNEEQPIMDDMGQPALNLDGTPITVSVPKIVEYPTYLGASLELIDVFDFFFTPEKETVEDREPFIIRSRRRPSYFNETYFFNRDKVKKTSEQGGDTSSQNDNLRERRRLAGLEVDKKYFSDHCIYLEWQGYYDPADEVDDSNGEKYPAGFYVIGVVTGTQYEDTLVRFDYKPFPLKGTNIIVGSLIEEFGELIGQRFVDNFHGIQHALDSVMGLWFSNLRQLVKRPKVVNSDAIKDPAQINTSVDETIEVEDRDDVTKAVFYPDVPSLSPDLYNGLSMLRTMGQSVSGIKDQSEGIAQTGVETLGEAEILAMETKIGINDYIRTWERTFVRPLYKKRNSINSYYLTNEYVISVIGERGLEWRTMTPAQIRADVDFICEASTRETQRGIIAQQIIQTLQPLMNLMTLYANMGYPPNLWPRVDLLLAELYDQWTWQQDKIDKILPSTTMDDQQEMALAQLLQEMAMMKMMSGQEATMGSQGGDSKQPDSARTPQPRTEAEANRSANDRNDTHVGRMQ